MPHTLQLDKSAGRSATALRRRLIQVSHGALQVSAYVQIGAGAVAIQVDLRTWEWQELQLQGIDLKLVIPSRAILWLQA